MDANKDGIITVDELVSVFKKVDKSMQRQDIEHIIKMADTNDDGGLSMYAACLAVLFGFPKWRSALFCHRHQRIDDDVCATQAQRQRRTPL